MIDPEEIKEVALKFQKCGPFFIALGDEIRQKILMILSEAGINGMNVSDITEKTHLSRPAISHHLKILKNTGLIYSYKKGTQNFYYICLIKNLDKIKDLIESAEKLNAKVDMEQLKKDAPWLAE